MHHDLSSEGLSHFTSSAGVEHAPKQLTSRRRPNDPQAHTSPRPLQGDNVDPTQPPIDYKTRRLNPLPADHSQAPAAHDDSLKPQHLEEEDNQSVQLEATPEAAVKGGEG
jgi:hypothetical protein